MISIIGRLADLTRMVFMLRCALHSGQEDKIADQQCLEQSAHILTPSNSQSAWKSFARLSADKYTIYRSFCDLTGEFHTSIFCLPGDQMCLCEILELSVI